MRDGNGNRACDREEDGVAQAEATANRESHRVEPERNGYIYVLDRASTANPTDRRLPGTTTTRGERPC